MKGWQLPQRSPLGNGGLGTGQYSEVPLLTLTLRASQLVHFLRNSCHQRARLPSGDTQEEGPPSSG